MNIGYLSTIYHTSIIMKSQLSAIGSEKINWKLYPTGPAMIKGFSEGEVDLGYLGLPPVMIGIENGLKLKCIAGGHVEGTVMVASRKYDSFKKIGNYNELISQFEGKKIGVPSKGCIHDVIIRELTREYNIEIKNYGWADLIPYALEEGEIDAGVGTPAMAVAAESIASTRVIIPPEHLWPYNPSYGITIVEDLLSEKEEIITDFLKKHENNCNLIREFPEKSAKIASAELGLKDEIFALKTFKISPKYCASLPEEYIDSTMKFLPLLKDIGYLNTDLKSNDIFHQELIEKIHLEPPHYEIPLHLDSN